MEGRREGSKRSKGVRKKQKAYCAVFLCFSPSSLTRLLSLRGEEKLVMEEEEEVEDEEEEEQEGGATGAGGGGGEAGSEFGREEGGETAESARREE